MTHYYENSGWVDHTHRLGIQKMPAGYYLLQDDAGLFIWRHEETDTDSVVTCNKWDAYRGAVQDAKIREAKPQ